MPYQFMHASLRPSKIYGSLETPGHGDDQLHGVLLIFAFLCFKGLVGSRVRRGDLSVRLKMRDERSRP